MAPLKSTTQGIFGGLLVGIGEGEGRIGVCSLNHFATLSQKASKYSELEHVLCASGSPALLHFLEHATLLLSLDLSLVQFPCLKCFPSIPISLGNSS